MDDINKINYYIRITEEQNLSVRKLRERIKSREYERLDDNTKSKLINKEKVNVGDLIKDPILIRNKFYTNKISLILPITNAKLNIICAKIIPFTTV